MNEIEIGIGELTIIVTEELIEINLGIDELAGHVAETANKDGTSVDADILSRKVESHVDGLCSY